MWDRHTINESCPQHMGTICTLSVLGGMNMFFGIFPTSSMRLYINMFFYVYSPTKKKKRKKEKAASCSKLGGDMQFVNLFHMVSSFWKQNVLGYK